MSNSAVDAVLSTPELLQLILTYVPPIDLLTIARGVCQTWKTSIETDPILQWLSFTYPSYTPPASIQRQFDTSTASISQYVIDFKDDNVDVTGIDRPEAITGYEFPKFITKPILYRFWKQVPKVIDEAINDAFETEKQDDQKESHELSNSSLEEVESAVGEWVQQFIGTIPPGLRMLRGYNGRQEEIQRCFNVHFEYKDHGRECYPLLFEQTQTRLDMEPLEAQVFAEVGIGEMTEDEYEEDDAEGEPPSQEQETSTSSNTPTDCVTKDGPVLTVRDLLNFVYKNAILKSHTGMNLVRRMYLWKLMERDQRPRQLPLWSRFSHMNPPKDGDLSELCYDYNNQHRHEYNNAHKLRGIGFSMELVELMDGYEEEVPGPDFVLILRFKWFEEVFTVDVTGFDQEYFKSELNERCMSRSKGKSGGWVAQATLEGLEFGYTCKDGQMVSDYGPPAEYMYQ